MKQAMVGILCFFVIISMVFNYSSDFDYTYDGISYGVDFETPTNINAAKIQVSFDTVLRYGNRFTDFLTNSFSSFWETFSSDLNSGDVEFDSFYAELRERSFEYIDANYTWNKWWYENKLNLMTDILRGYQQFFFIKTKSPWLGEDLVDYGKKFGWSDDEISIVHDFLLKQEYEHEYNGQWY